MKREKDLKSYKNLLQQYGIKSTFPRVIILQYIDNLRNHPTAHEIYTSLIKEIPTLSRATVYNSIKMFVKKKILMPITIDGLETRYDIITKPHLHFKCIKCGNIYDIFSEDINIFLKKENINGHQILERHIYLKGICKECR